MPDLSTAYQNAAFIPGGDDYPARWAEKAAAFRAERRPETHAYGPGPREVFDLFRPSGAARGTLVFIHGGYWMETDRTLWSHLAAGAVARGWAVAIPSYDLCPAVRIATITRQISAAVDAVAALTPGPSRVTGHSAGGHLAARMACADAAPRAPIERIVPISVLSNLVPLMHTDLNATLQIDAAEAAAESPVLHPRPAMPVHLWVGAAERPAFLDQSRWLSRAWDAPLTLDPGRHHFDVIEGLEQPDSALTSALLD
jgi:acetyl esterase/lipase